MRTSFTAIEVLESEHHHLQELFGRVSEPDEDRSAVLQELMKTVTHHLNMEKEVLLPVVRERVEGGAALADDVTTDHDESEKILILLERRKVNSPDVPDLVTRLLEINDRHVGHADHDLIPALRSTLAPSELADLGAEMSSDERATLTHSHPGLPDTGPVAAVGRKLAEVVDHVRDRSTDVGRTNS